MILVGERINTGFKDIKQAVLDKDPGPLREWAQKQAAAGATYLDVNLGAVSADAAVMCWMIEQVQSVVETPVSIDTNKASILAEAIKVCNKPPLINSTTAAQEKLDAFLPIAAEHNASIIGLSIDETGTPKSADGRVEKAGMVLAAATEAGIPPEHVFLDPIVMPLKYMQDQMREILEAVRQFRLFSDPPPHIICGLSNVSNGTTHKKLINRTFLVMAVGCGLDAAICDVTDGDLVDAAKTAELVMNREIYADSYIKPASA
ncbi:MAG: methyltetrahydrofolate--corrinoid methyltransferase [Lentisphaerae bacterium]|nr:methyltetrahydrofolate--corrinoid methyltransferase [Lentisphaerota bacterium]